MSEDDYKADLDAVNISNLIIEEELNEIEAVSEYYGALEQAKTTREKEFLENMGGGSIGLGMTRLEITDEIISKVTNIRDLPDMMNNMKTTLREGYLPMSEGDKTMIEFKNKLIEGLIGNE